ncbi:hypothetical protein E2C01_068448 [Portunus trituberculatus]|uniref:Uncharacterized protein n=1 Tax=Portunus trituberculatus TaxID=210409 RepID=A0A5B7HS04_PORTR|nr:hypothetical protein [Portunus trituberculatus]
MNSSFPLLSFPHLARQHLRNAIDFGAATRHHQYCMHPVAASPPTFNTSKRYIHILLFYLTARDRWEANNLHMVYQLAHLCPIHANHQ